MRDFGAPAGAHWRTKIVEEAQAVFMAAQTRQDRRAAEFAMDGDPERTVATEAEVVWDEGRMRVAISRPSERPPFEWEMEITSEIDEADYFKHYLVREDDVVLAQRKILTEIDEAEAKLIIKDLNTARRVLTKSS